MPIQKPSTRPLTDVYRNAFAEWKKNQSQEARIKIIEGLGRLTKLIYRLRTHSFEVPLFRVTKDKMLEAPGERNKPDTFSYPSPHKCDEARANKAGCPVFYAADNPLTALKEARPEPDECIYLSRWEVKRPKNSLFYLFMTDEFTKSDFWTPILDNMQEFSRESEALSGEEEAELRELHRLYCDTFASDDYDLSSLIGHYLLYEHPGKPVDALVYPSQADACRSCNFAIATRFADTHLSLSAVYYMKAVSDEDFTRSVVLEKGTLVREEIEWKPVRNKRLEDFPETLD